jgi:hypothetical protein
VATRRAKRRVGALVSPIDLAQRERNRTLIAAAPVELVERDGRTFQLRRLPAAEPGGDETTMRVRPRTLRRGVAIA